ncbi:MFS transporter [Roseateles albus]|uniref:MFS transporter n=1 Tax=Roseateles albus TaxID=2987525 RepID=A0ABT5KHX5_9BURK|nr:MFS transporter [Roseateles albus]MDC8773513.1 MFS transporter [Roseateles albus]
MTTHPGTEKPLPIFNQGSASSRINVNTTSPSARQNLAWLVVAMLAISTFLNYIDRQTLSLLARPIQEALSMDDKAYSIVVTSFMVAYTLGNLSSGLLIDRLGAVRALPFFVAAWSIAGALSGMVQSSPELAVSRFFLGLFETGNFIAAPIIVSMYLPTHQRAFGVGLYTAAAMLGAAVSPPLLTHINEAVGWRMAFVLMGGAGLLWVLVWCLLPLKRNARQTDVAREAASPAAGVVDVQTWRQALAEPRVWAYGLGAMLTFPVWFFYLNWFPKYLTDERGLSTMEMGAKAWVVYLSAGIGCMVAGGILAKLIRSGLPPVRARLYVMASVCIAAPVGAINFWEPSIEISLASAACVALIHMIWQTTITTLPLELFTAKSLGKVFGVAGVASGLGGIFSTWLIGQLVGVVSYKPMFLVMSVAYVLAMAVIILLLKRGKPLPP